MPKLGQTKIQTVYLPSTAQEENPEDKAWVKINTSVRVADIDGIEDVDGAIEQSVFAISRLVTEWNLTNVDNDEIAPINAETVKQLSMQDFNYLQTWLKDQVAVLTQGVPTPLKESSSSI